MDQGPDFDHMLAARVVADVASALAIAGTFMHIVPAFTAFLAMAWYMVNLYESRPVQTWIRLHRHKKRRRRTGRPVHAARVHHISTGHRRKRRRHSEPAEV